MDEITTGQEKEKVVLIGLITNKQNETQALEYIDDDEFLEVTPRHLRMRKILLSELDRRRHRDRIYDY